MSSDFRQSANNANNNANNKEGANPSSSFQGKTKKAKSSSAAKKEENKSLIEKNLREGYDDYSKGEDLISLVAQRIVRGNDFSPKAIITEVEQTKKEKISELKSRYPGTFKDEDFSSNNIEKPSSGMIDTETQRTFRDLINETAKKSVISAKAIEELAGLEYFSEHIKGLEEKAKTGEIAERKVEEEKTLPALSSAPHIPLGALPHTSTPHRAPMSSPASHTLSASIPSPKISHISPSSPQAPQPSQGGGNQGGGMSMKSGVSSSAPADKSSSPAPASAPPASSAPAHIAPSTPASQTPQNADESIAPTSAPASTPASAVSPQTADESPSVPAHKPFPHTAPKPASKPVSAQSKDLSSQDSARSSTGDQSEKAPAEPVPQPPITSAPQEFPASSPPQAPQTPAAPAQTINESVPSSASSPPSQAPATSAKTPPPSQGLEKPTTDNASEENGGEMTKEKIEKIKDAVREKLEDSLEKNIDNGMGGVMIQGKGEKSDADKIKAIKALAEQKNLNDQRDRISLINSAIKMDSARVDPAGREAEAQRIRKEAEEKAEEEMRKEIGGVKGKIAAKILSKMMGMAAYKMAQELSERANRGKGQLALVVAFTLFLAIAADLIDIKRAATVILSAATVALFIFGIIVWLIYFIISSLLTATISIFWMQLAGGGHSKLLWKIIIRNVFGIVLNGIPIFGGIPFTVIIVLWNWYDFAKERNEAKKELKTFVAKNKSLLRNVSAS